MVEYPEIELMSAEVHGEGSGHNHGYKVEVRTSYHDPTLIPLADGKVFVIDLVWREWPIREGVTPFGVNIPIKSWDRSNLDRGLVSYVVAEAHRWALLAHLEASTLAGSLCVQTRLVKVKLHYTYKLEEVGVTSANVHGNNNVIFSQRQKN